jgi:hypothetical protein
VDWLWEFYQSTRFTRSRSVSLNFTELSNYQLQVQFRRFVLATMVPKKSTPEPNRKRRALGGFIAPQCRGDFKLRG